MKTKFTALFIALSVAAQTLISPALAEIKIIIPSRDQQATDTFEQLRKDQISDFLAEYHLVSRCLRNKRPGNEPLRAFYAACLVLQVFDTDRVNRSRAWTKAVRVGLLDRNTKRYDNLSGVEFLDMLFKAAGVTLSGLDQSTYLQSFQQINLRLPKDELLTIATAIDKGLMAQPSTYDQGVEIRQALGGSISVSDAMSFLYQIWSSGHEQAVINFVDFPSTIGNVEMGNILHDVIQIFNQESYYSSTFNEKKAMEAAIRAVVEELSEDEYAEFYNEDEYAGFADSLNGNLEGIGAYIEEKDGLILIVSPIDGSPAFQAGLKPGDQITHVDGESTDGLGINKTVGKIRGPEGSTVVLTVIRDGQTFDVTIVRNKITVPALTATRNGEIEVVKMIQFSSTSSAETKAEIEHALSTGAKGMVLDLRNNPGGFLNEVVNIVDLFVEQSEPLVYLQDRVNRTPLYGGRDPIVPEDFPIAVLINRGSASASEILAGALQSYGIAELYGENSFGKGTVQNVVTLQEPDMERPAAFKYTTSEYLIPLPNGDAQSIDKVGVEPKSNPLGEPLVDDPETEDVDEALNEVLRLLRLEVAERE